MLTILARLEGKVSAVALSGWGRGRNGMGSIDKKWRINDVEEKEEEKEEKGGRGRPRRRRKEE